MLAVFEVAAADHQLSCRSFLGQGELLIHGTTRATNAILTGETARTAFLTTEGHPDILLYREGGRTEPFNNLVPFPDPYVPRSLTFEIPERIGANGAVIKSLDERAIVDIARQLGEKRVEAVGVCLLWSIVNPAHELRVGEILGAALPTVAVTLSHQLNPSLREYRRASSTCIDASLRPIMSAYLGSLEARLRAAGFRGRLLSVTSNGSVVDAADFTQAPIHAIQSGPSMAPLAGRYYARATLGVDTAIVADTGGTSYDVSLVRHGRIPFTRDTWLGEPFRGHITGFPSVDVRSIGAGGGSIAWVDDGGLLHVGPRSAGSIPGPACYRKGGVEPTVTDAALALGYVNPDYFLGGAIKLDVDAATEAIHRAVGEPLRLGVHDAALAMLSLVSEQMARAIEDVTINQGMDPATAVLIGGGGAAGLNAVAIARRLGCPRVIVPMAGAALSAAGALMADLGTTYSGSCFTTSQRFDAEAVNTVLEALEARCRRFAEGPGLGSLDHRIEFSVEARYPHQVWEVTVPLRSTRFRRPADLEQLVEDMHACHEELFAISDRGSPVELIIWTARVSCQLPRADRVRVASSMATIPRAGSRWAYFLDVGQTETAFCHWDALAPGERRTGPIIIEANFTTVVVDPGAEVTRSPEGSLLISPKL
jgi:N-methylhydantoinase A